MTLIDGGAGMTGPSDESRIASARVAGPAGHEASGLDIATDGTALDEQVVLRITNVPRDVGWMMVSVGLLGVILPGIIGTPFLVTGIAVLTPGGPRLLARWARRDRNGVMLAGLRQMGRWLDDLERRYPRQHAS
jgi:hypothetical protein